MGIVAQDWRVRGVFVVWTLPRCNGYTRVRSLVSQRWGATGWLGGACVCSPDHLTLRLLHLSAPTVVQGCVGIVAPG